MIGSYSRSAGVEAGGNPLTPVPLPPKRWERGSCLRCAGGSPKVRFPNSGAPRPFSCKGWRKIGLPSRKRGRYDPAMNALIFLALTAAADPAGPLGIDRPVIDCGEARAGLPLVQKFQVTNCSREVLKVAELVPLNCGCVRATMTARALLPGESAEVAVEVNTLGQPAGPNTWKTALRYRIEPGGDAKPTTGEQVLELKANVVREVIVDPVALSLILDGPAKHAIKITDRRAKPLSLREVRVSSTHLKATTQNGEAPGEHRIELSVLEAPPAGRHAEVLTIETNDPEYKSFQITVQITRRSANQVTALPENVSLRLASGQTSASSLVRLRDGGGRRVVVEKIEADHPAIRTKWAAGPDAMATLRITVEAGTAKEGLGTVKVHLSEPPGQVVSIPVSWR